ncbi:MAG: trimethylamine methyltransferase family protein [Anaerolineae bacterium]
MDSAKAGYRNFRILSDEQCQQIHLASLEILRRTGVRVMDPEAVRLLADAGAEVEQGDRVHIPAHLVEWGLRAAPKRVILSHRDQKRALWLENRNVYFGTGSDCPYILDSITGQRRKFLKEDVAQGIRLCDALPNIDFVLSIGLISDVPTEVSDLHQFEAMVLNTTKPIVFTSHTPDNCRAMVEMAEVVAGGETELRRNPFIASFVEANPPLKINSKTAREILYMAEKMLPVIFSCGPMMGVSGPQTHAGIIAQANAESLTGLLIMQLKRQGAPFIYAQGVHPLDMRTTVLSYGAPELSLNTGAAADLAHYYGLPVWGYAGCSDAKRVDQQAAMEATASIIMSVLTGNNLVHDVGYLESGLMSSFEMILLSDIAIEMTRHLLKPIQINEETLALDLIDKVGPGGNFLEEPHTLRHFREVWYHDLIDRKNHDGWLADGGLSMGERLNRHVKQILNTYQPSPVPFDQAQAIRTMVREVEQRLTRKGA